MSFASTKLRDWLSKKLAPLFHPIRSETKTNQDSFARVSRALRQLHVITWNFDWFTVSSAFFVIGSSD